MFINVIVPETRLSEHTARSTERFRRWRRIARSKPRRTKMSAIISTDIRPRAASLSRLLGAYCDRIARHFSHRAAVARLREFDDGALRDIGLARSEIEAAVHGLITRSGRAKS
jgi:uncharacterized protein YjiS (DUF1127 family)